MIHKGDLVQDWLGRAGIALEFCDPPEIKDCDEDLERVKLHYGKSFRWRCIHLFSGTIVSSPEPATDSWGPASKPLLEWATNRSGGPSKLPLLALLKSEES